MDRRPQDDFDASGFDDASGADLQSIWAALLKYKWLISAVAIVVTVLVAFWSIRLPKVYDAVATLEFDPTPMRPLGDRVDDVANPVDSSYMSKQWLETQQKIIASRQVAASVVRDLGLHKDPEFFGIAKEDRASWQGVPTERAARLLVTRVRVEPLEKTRLVQIHVTDSNPERASLLANAVAEAYIGKVQRDRMGSTRSALDWLSSQLDKLTGQLDEAERALHDFKKEYNVLSVALEDRLNVVGSDIQQLSSALTRARMKRIELEARFQALESLRQQDPLAINVVLMEESATLGHLKDSYRKATSERAELATRYGESHPTMRSLDSKPSTLREQIDEEVKGLMEGAASSLEEARVIEHGLAAALDQTNEAALELNLLEIEFGQLHRERENKSKLQALLLERTTETSLTRMLHVDTVRVLDSALTPSRATKPNVRQNVAFGLTGGLLLGIAFALLLTFSDRTVKHESDIEALGVACLGILPFVVGDRGGEAPKQARRARRRGPSPTGADRVAHTLPMSAAAECARSIRTNLTFMAAERAARTIVVTSSSPQEGKTLVAVNLAIVLAQTGHRVLIVDTDLRRPRIHRIFDCPSEHGVTSYLVGQSTFEEIVQESDVPHLAMVPCGPIPPNPSELLHGKRFRQLIEEASQSFDTVIFDSPPLGAVTDAAVIGHEVDGAILVARLRQTHRELLRASTKQLLAIGTNVLGVVLNAVDLSRKDYGYRYAYRRAGYYGEPNSDKPDKGRDVEAA